MRLLLIEDEDALREQLEERLRAEGFAVEAAANGLDGLYLGEEYPFDVGIFDVGLPDTTGIEIIKKLRGQGKDFPILILTARSRWQEKVEGLEAGADDYITKPFHVEEVLARLNALVRRSAGWADPVLSVGPLKIDTRTQDVFLNEERVDLTSFEYKVIAYLMLHQGKVISKTELTEHIYEEDDDRDSNVIEVFVRRLRKKLDPKSELNPIETLRGRGYRLNLSD